MKKIIACILILICLTSCSKDEIIITEFDLMLPNFTVGELMNETSLVVRVKYTGEKESFRIKESNSEGKKNITDITFECNEVLYGEYNIGEKICVRVDGGEADGYDEIYNGNPEFVKGREYVLFLYQLKSEPNEDRKSVYYIPGVCMGVFEMRADRNEKTTEITPYMHVSGAGFTYRDIADYIKDNYG